MTFAGIGVNDAAALSIVDSTARHNITISDGVDSKRASLEETPRRSAEPERAKRSAEFTVDFRWDSAKLDQSYMGTAERLKALADSIASISIGRIDSLTVSSYSSPEGKYLYNKRLAERRAASLALYLSRNYPELQSRMTVDADGESWHLFRKKVLEDRTISEAQREKLLEIIDAPVSADRKKVLLKTYDPALWRHIVRTWFKEMRRSFIGLYWTGLTEETARPEAFAGSPAVAPALLLTPPDYPIHPTVQDIYTWQTILALKTNLLYDAVTALNFELEIPVGKDFSIAVEDVFPWWTAGPNGKKYCFQMWEMGIEPRWWFARNEDSRDRLAGHFLGAYGMSARYDFQWDTKLCYQGEYWSAGLTYGYSLPLGKVVNMEFSASVGFLQSHYRHYQPDADYEHLYRDPFLTGTWSWFGPTKLKVSLVVPIVVKRKLSSR